MWQSEKMEMLWTTCLAEALSSLMVTPVLVKARAISRTAVVSNGSEDANCSSRSCGMSWLFEKTSEACAATWLVYSPKRLAGRWTASLPLLLLRAVSFNVSTMLLCREAMPRWVSLLSRHPPSFHNFLLQQGSFRTALETASLQRRSRTRLTRRFAHAEGGSAPTCLTPSERAMDSNPVLEHSCVPVSAT